MLVAGRPHVVRHRPLLWSRLMCTSEGRREKQEGPSVQAIPDRDGEGGEVGRRHRHWMEFKVCTRMCAGVCVCAFPGVSVPQSLSCSIWLYSTELQTVFVIKRCLLSSVKMYSSFWQHKFMNLFKSCLHATELEKPFPNVRDVLVSSLAKFLVLVQLVCTLNSRADSWQKHNIIQPLTDYKLGFERPRWHLVNDIWWGSEYRVNTQELEALHNVFGNNINY